MYIFYRYLINMKIWKERIYNTKKKMKNLPHWSPDVSAVGDVKCGLWERCSPALINIKTEMLTHRAGSLLFVTRTVSWTAFGTKKYNSLIFNGWLAARCRDVPPFICQNCFYLQCKLFSVFAIIHSTLINIFDCRRIHVCTLIYLF